MGDEKIGHKDHKETQKPNSRAEYPTLFQFSVLSVFSVAKTKKAAMMPLLHSNTAKLLELVVLGIQVFGHGGHVIIEGLPGLGKTHLAKALAAALGLHWARVQCTPDLLPADVTGAEIYVTAGQQVKCGETLVRFEA